MVNSFPVILQQVFHKAGLRTPQLDRYIREREKLFAEILTQHPTLTREKLKTLFLCALHMGNYLNHDGGLTLTALSQFSAEVRSCAALLLRRPEFAGLVTLAKTKKESKGGFVNGTLIGWICQIEESRIMNAKSVYTEILGGVH